MKESGVINESNFPDSKVALVSPYEKDQKIKKIQTMNFDSCSKRFLYTHFYLRDIIYLSKILRALLSNKNGILHFWNSQ